MKYLAFLALLPAVAQATPRMSLTAGTPCAACHVNPNGGEMRTDLGWSAHNHTGALTWDQLGLQSFHEVDTNTFVDGMLAFGFDWRGQLARLGRPEIDEATGETTVPDYTAFPMQVQPYLSLKPATEWTLYTTFLAGPGTLRDSKICDPVFAGMSCYGAQVIYEPGGTLPTLRAGMFQPSIGVRPEDHTVLVRGDAANPRIPTIAPGYAELGAEAAYQPKQWVRAEVGGFHTGNLDDALNGGTETADLWPASYAARLTFQPVLEFGGGAEEAEDDFDDFDDEPVSLSPFALNTWLGASILGSGDFRFIDAFLGLGTHEGLSLLFEVSHSVRTVEHETLNGMLGLSYSPWDWIAGSLRAGRATTSTEFQDYESTQYVATLELFPLPYMELRPEYRLVETDQYRLGQFTLQWHFFY